MAKLIEPIKHFIVQRLAMYDTPQQVADAVKEEFSVEVHRSHVAGYDARRTPKPAAKWCALFDATRKNFLETVGDIPIAQKSVRLRRLERMALSAERARNWALAAQLHEQAAKEMGEYYTNKRVLGLGDSEGNPFPAGVTVTIGAAAPAKTAGGDPA